MQSSPASLLCPSFGPASASAPSPPLRFSTFPALFDLARPCRQDHELVNCFSCPYLFMALFDLARRALGASRHTRPSSDSRSGCPFKMLRQPRRCAAASGAFQPSGSVRFQGSDPLFEVNVRAREDVQSRQSSVRSERR